MNGIEKIIDRIAADTQLEVIALNNEAAAKCTEITEHYKRVADEEYEKIVSDGKAAADLHFERLCSAAQLDAKKQMLKEKQEIVAMAFERAISILRALPDDKYSALLAKFAYYSSRSGREQIILSREDREKFGNQICELANKLLASKGKTAELSLSDAVRNIRGGLILVDGKIETNCSFEVLVNGCKDELTGEVAKILFD